VFQNYAALIKAESATIQADKEERKRLLEEAISHMERCVELCTKYVATTPLAHFFAVLGWYLDWFGGILNQLYSLTGEEGVLRKAIKVYEDTAETYQKAELPSRVAEAQWQVARLADRLGEHTKSERNFQLASENYKLAAEKIPQLKEFYMDHALYMQAWSEIEKAKHHHTKSRYGQAKEYYEKAAGLHQSTEHWNYLSSNYLAWAKLEEAEDLSRREHGEEATQAFKEAADMFCTAKNAIRTQLKDIQDRDEKGMAADLVNASDLRHDYCEGRIALEDAKILDRQGDHMASSKRYGAAAEMLQEIGKAGPEETRRELQPIVFLCQAWQKMMMAEAKASAPMYGEAAELFEKAKEYTLDQSTSLLALGNSSFCKALQAGTEFESTGEMAAYLAAKKQVEAASKYYLKAGFKDAAEYARATFRLFDAYMYMNKAQTEIDPRKKAQYYQMAEKVLQAAAGSYVKAKHSEKSEEVRRLLRSVQEERQLAVSLSEVLHVPMIASTTGSFATPAPTREQAVGLERFEHADIQANLILKVTEVKVGQDVDLEIELVNTGKAPALLMKVQEVIPEEFEIRKAPETYRFEGSHLNMKGRKLAPLKTEEIQLVLRPANKGTYTLKPRVMYVDETGKYRSHEPEPVTIIVKELGIKGWIKGEK
jgi:tetratricopeptide (TPR) repeat protein